MSTTSSFVLRLRPAPLSSAVASLLGLNKRRVIQSLRGRFLANPVSRFGSSIEAGEYEPGMTAVLQRYLKPGSAFIDLGANEGYFSVIASSLVGADGKVIAIEPQSRLQGVLSANFGLNGCNNIQLVAAVISSSSTNATIHLTSGPNTGGTSLFRSTKYSLRTEEVKSYTLAGFMSHYNVGRCDLMKVDIEGAEYEALMDAGDVLRSGRIHNIALEIHNSILKDRGLSGFKLHERMLACGYELDTGLGNWVYTFAGRRN